MDPRWLVKKNEWSEEAANAIHFFEELRVLFASGELIQHFPVVLEYYQRSDIRRRTGESGLRTTRADFHIRTIVSCLEESEEGIFVIERHLPPDMVEDRALLFSALENAARGPGR